MQLIYQCSNSDGQHILDVNGIIRVQGINNYSIIHIAGREPIILSKTLLIIEEELKKQ